MSGKSTRRSLIARPPARSVDEFAAGAVDTPAKAREPHSETLPAAPPPQEDTRSGEGLRRQTVRFILRLSPRHHEMLAWLSERSRKGHRKDSMQAIALDLLAPALEDAVRRKRKELGL